MGTVPVTVQILKLQIVDHLIGKTMELEEKIQILDTSHHALLSRVDEPYHGIETWSFEEY
jgi:hypothetical protein